MRSAPITLTPHRCRCQNKISLFAISTVANFAANSSDKNENSKFMRIRIQVGDLILMSSTFLCTRCWRRTPHANFWLSPHGGSNSICSTRYISVHNGNSVRCYPKTRKSRRRKCVFHVNCVCEVIAEYVRLFIWKSIMLAFE